MCLVLYQRRQDKRKTVGEARSTFMSAMSDAGLKPTVVYHNLSPAVLYEKVRAACHADRALTAVFTAMLQPVNKGMQRPGVRPWALSLAGRMQSLPDRFP